jgi:hypothetical protein
MLCCLRLCCTKLAPAHERGDPGVATYILPTFLSSPTPIIYISPSSFSHQVSSHKVFELAISRLLIKSKLAENAPSSTEYSYLSFLGNDWQGEVKSPTLTVEQWYAEGVKATLGGFSIPLSEQCDQQQLLGSEATRRIRRLHRYLRIFHCVIHEQTSNAYPGNRNRRWQAHDTGFQHLRIRTNSSSIPPPYLHNHWYGQDERWYLILKQHSLTWARGKWERLNPEGWITVKGGGWLMMSRVIVRSFLDMSNPTIPSREPLNSLLIRSSSYQFTRYGLFTSAKATSRHVASNDGPMIARAWVCAAWRQFLRGGRGMPHRVRG